MIEGSSSDSQDAVGLIEHLKAERRTGCLTLESTAYGTYRLYLLFGRVYHAVGPSAEGSSALDEAMSLRDATPSFDEQARLPERHTMSVGPAGVGDSQLLPLQRSPKWSRWVARGAIRSCLVVVVLLVVGLPLALVIAGVALAPLGLRTEAGYRSAPICSSSPTNTPCYLMQQVSVVSANYQWRRWGSWTEHVTVDTASGSRPLIIYAVPDRPGQGVRGQYYNAVYRRPDV
jgi:hypothetical protein